MKHTDMIKCANRWARRMVSALEKLPEVDRLKWLQKFQRTQLLKPMAAEHAFWSRPYNRAWSPGVDANAKAMFYQDAGLNNLTRREFLDKMRNRLNYTPLTSNPTWEQLKQIATPYSLGRHRHLNGWYHQVSSGVKTSPVFGPVGIKHADPAMYLNYPDAPVKPLPSLVRVNGEPFRVGGRSITARDLPQLPTDYVYREHGRRLTDSQFVLPSPSLPFVTGIPLAASSGKYGALLSQYPRPSGLTFSEQLMTPYSRLRRERMEGLARGETWPAYHTGRSLFGSDRDFEAIATRAKLVRPTHYLPESHYLPADQVPARYRRLLPVSEERAKALESRTMDASTQARQDWETAIQAITAARQTQSMTGLHIGKLRKHERPVQFLPW